MAVYLILLLLLCLIEIKLRDNNDILEKNQTTAVKGIFTIIVFLSHCRGYFGQMIETDQTYFLFDFVIRWIGQLMVAPFLFYSGYGILESVKNKEAYIQNLPKRRIVPIIGHLAMVLVLYVIMNLVMHISYPTWNYVFCWIGWETIGNSNWYIFDIILLYTLTWIVFTLASRYSLRTKVVLVTFITMVMVVLLRVFHKEDWWYNTILCYPLGMFISLYVERVKSIIKNAKLYWGTLVITIVLFFLLHRAGNVITYMISACLFCIIVLLLSKKVKVGNPILIWIGMHLFEIYILQRIPMTMLSSALRMPAWLFVILSWVIVCALAFLMEKLFKISDTLWKKCIG